MSIPKPIQLGKLLSAFLLCVCTFSIALKDEKQAELQSKSVGQPVNIAPSAYQYRADRSASANSPESWIGLMHFAHLPLNKPVDPNNAEIRRCLVGLLWEEIRPIQTIELTWPQGSNRQPRLEDVSVSALLNQGGSSSWWNNLESIKLDTKPIVTNGGRTYTFTIGRNTCGLVASIAGSRNASQFDVPQVRVLVPDSWKAMDVEIEWGFDKTTSGRDYSGRLEAYDGRISSIRPLVGDKKTSVTKGDSWKSIGKTGSRRGIQLGLLYMGKSKWPRQQGYTTPAEEIARTIITVWTKAGNFSFLAADLENGPILAPEYGFWVRRTSRLATSNLEAPLLKLASTPLTARMRSIAGDGRLKGWGSDATPWLGSNPSDRAIQVLGINFPPKSVAMHPGQSEDVVVEWHSPIQGKVKLAASLTHAQAGSNGIEWWVEHDTHSTRKNLGSGSTNGTGTQRIPSDNRQHALQDSVVVSPGDVISIVVGPKGDHRCDSTLVDWTIIELGGQERTWSLSKDVGTNPQEANPHIDSMRHPNTWRFCSRFPTVGSGPISQPPFSLASNATSAASFIKELKSRGLKTIREKIQVHSEQNWERAVMATRGANLPPHPVPPIGSEPVMQVEVPSERMTAQWNLGVWHLMRHCATNPKTGKLWFNDFPYGILAAETYLVLSVLDMMGSHEAAADGFDQWLSLPLKREHPVGLFSDGIGALTFAVGPDGYGGQMDGIHSFGPGSIGWALNQHYWMTGDKDWLRASAPRLIANAEWMLRQRRKLRENLPGGKKLWASGLQPALQVTPDSGGLWMQFYECEAYYWSSITQLASTIQVVDPVAGSRLKAEAEAYRKDLLSTVERSIALSPVVAVRDGTFHSVIPFASYVRGSATGAWGWQREGSGSHVGPLYWDTVQSAAALISPAALLAPNDVRVQGYLDVLEDRFLLENPNVGNRDWFQAGWQYQGGLERTANMHLATDDIPTFLRSFFNCYAVDILPNDGYVFNEHAVHGPPDKIFEEAAFLERFRNLLVMEDSSNLWIARGTPRAWLEQGKRISVKNAPSRFGNVNYEIVSEAASGKILATLSIPSRNPPKQVWLRIRHPQAKPIRGVTVDGKEWQNFDSGREIVKLHGVKGVVKVVVRY